MKIPPVVLEILTLIYLLSIKTTHSFQHHFLRQSPCNVIEKLKSDNNVKEIGSSKWEDSCPQGRFVSAVWSEKPNELFKKIKCCGNSTDSSVSWEIRDVSLFHKGEYDAKKRWNVECDKYSVITGFRFFRIQSNQRVLSSVRCSILVNKVIDKEDCTVMNFTAQNTSSKTGYNDPWFHQCNKDSALVGLYDSNNFFTIEKAKCCKIKDYTMNLNWKTDFSHNFGGLEENPTNNLIFKTLDGGNYIKAQSPANSVFNTVQLITPGISSDKPICIRLTFVPQVNFQLAAVIKDDSTIRRSEFRQRYNRSAGNHFYINITPMKTAQLYIDIEIATRGFFIIREVATVSGLCPADECNPITNAGCKSDEACHDTFGYHRCDKKGQQSSMKATYSFQNPFMRRKITSPCNVIEKLKSENNVKEIGSSKWEDSCPQGRFVSAVWSEKPNDLFKKIKCCGKSIDSSVSWEIRDIGLFHKGEYDAKKRWNVECDKYSVITGFRFLTNKSNQRVLSSVRCSILVNKVIDKEDCTVMNFTAQNTSSKTGYNDPWFHQCNKDFALVGLYDSNNFFTIEKAKCCKIKDYTMNLNWKTDFSHNFGGLEQNPKNSLIFKKLDGGNYIKAQPTSNYVFNTAQLITPGISGDDPICLRLYFVPHYGFQLKAFIKDNSTIRQSEFLQRYNRSAGNHFFINIKPMKTAQLYIYIQMGVKGFFIIREIVTVSGLCPANQCNPKTNIGCKLGEKCEVTSGYHRCLKKNFHSTKPTPTRTSGSGKGPQVVDGTTAEPKITTKAKSTINSDSPVIVKSTDDLSVEKVEKEKEIPPFVYGVIGSSIVIVVVLIVMSVFMCQRRYMLLKGRPRCQSNLYEMDPVSAHINAGYHPEACNKYSARSSSSMVSSTHPIYVPFMNDIGHIERPVSRIGSSQSFIGSSSPHFIASTSSGLCYIDKTTGEPLYTRIDRSFSGIVASTSAVDDFESNTPSAHVHYTEIEKSKENESKHCDEKVLDAACRRPSSITLVKPDYGDSESEEEDDDSPKFIEPGDDEEDLIDSLNELPQDSVQVSSKILGQGAFGLVKLGTLISVNGSRQVAMKFLKISSHDQESSQEERIRFYQEAAIMSQFDHPNVITLYGIMVGRKPCMVLEFLKRGNLWKYLNRVRRVRKRENKTEISAELHSMFLRMARDIAAGMAYLAGLDFVHRDLAARNILLDSNLQCKIADFGLSRHFLKNEHYYQCHGGQIPVKWTAPEALEFKKYSTQSDVWSYGIVLWEIWSIGERPYNEWKNEKVIQEITEKAYRLPAPAGIPKLLYKLMLDCWHPDKKKRPTFSKIEYCLKHKDERIIGKSKKEIPRSRSITFSSNDEDLQSIDSTFSDLQNIYCKTE